MLAETLEKHVEAALRRRVRALGGECEKFTSPAKRSVPDRLITLPAQWRPVIYGGPSEVADWEPPVFCFVETKRPGGKPTPKQTKDHERRRAMGVAVFVVDTMEAARAFPF